MAVSKIDSDLTVLGHLKANSMTVAASSVTNASVDPNAEIARSKLAQNTLTPFTIPLTDFRVWNAINTILPGAGATDDLGIIGGTFATGSPSLQTQDHDTEAGNPSTNYARVQYVLPAEYDDGETITVRIHAGMLTTIADDSAFADVQAYKSDEEAGIGADLCTTAMQSINSVTLADKDFVITPTGVVTGDTLDIRIATIISDVSSGTPVIGIIGAVQMLLDIRG